MAVTTKKKRPAKKQPTTAAIHAIHEDGEHHAVAILNLHVLIVPDGKFWFAQGLEVDYAVQGENIEDVKQQFQTGFKATIHEHLKMFGNIDKMLKVAPSEVWHEYLTTPKAQNIYTHASIHEVLPEPQLIASQLQFEQIEYIVPKAAAACA